MVGGHDDDGDDRDEVRNEQAPRPAGPQHGPEGDSRPRRVGGVEARHRREAVVERRHERTVDADRGDVGEVERRREQPGRHRRKDGEGDDREDARPCQRVARRDIAGAVAAVEEDEGHSGDNEVGGAVVGRRRPHQRRVGESGGLHRRLVEDPERPLPRHHVQGVALGGRRRPAHPVPHDRVPLVEAGDEADLDHRRGGTAIGRRGRGRRPLHDGDRERRQRHHRRLIAQPPISG